MIARYFEFFDLKKLFTILIIGYILVLTSPNIHGFILTIGSLLFTTIVILIWNMDATENWKYLYTGVWTDLTDSVLSKEERVLKHARLGNINPLFVVVGKNYYYYDNNYKSNNVLDMSDTIDLLNQIKENLK